MKKKFRPETEPTGFRPDPGKKVVKVESVPEITKHTALALRVRAAYRMALTRRESVKQGEHVEAVVPKSYDGREAKTVDGIDGAVVEPAKESAWTRLVKFCAAKDINPEQYVRVSFEGLPLTKQTPTPGNLMGDEYVARWKAAVAKLDERLAILLRVQKAAASSHIAYREKVLKNDQTKAVLMTLGAGNLPLSPLFRYCSAVLMKDAAFDTLIENHAANAVLQFECFRDAYERVWAEILPEGFSKWSERVYPHVLVELGNRDPVDVRHHE